jgi:HEAT repeat protein
VRDALRFFAKIPTENPKASVLATVPGTPAAQEAVPTLLVATKDQDHEFARIAGDALAKIDPKARASNSAP